MTHEQPTPEKANRLAIGFARHQSIPYHEAIQRLRQLTLRICWHLSDAGTIADQLGLLTAANTGQRAFLGGIQVVLPANVPLLLSIPGISTLNAALEWLGIRSSAISAPMCTLHIGSVPDNAAPDDVVIYCDAWRGGAGDADRLEKFVAGDTDQMGLGGIFAGALGVHRCFVRKTGLPGQCLDQSSGLSLWDFQSDWRVPVFGRKIRQLPLRCWLLGLGHLGQAYLGVLHLCPMPIARPLNFYFMISIGLTIQILDPVCFVGKSQPGPLRPGIAPTGLRNLASRPG